MDLHKSELYFNQWNDSEAIATKMLPILNDLRVERGVLFHVHGRSIAKVSSIDILKVHRHARFSLGRELTVQDTWPILEAIGRLDLGPCRIDPLFHRVELHQHIYPGSNARSHTRGKRRSPGFDTDESFQAYSRPRQPVPSQREAVFGLADAAFTDSLVQGSLAITCDGAGVVGDVPQQLLAGLVGLVEAVDPQQRGPVGQGAGHVGGRELRGRSAAGPTAQHADHRGRV